ncbi:hypothetical protein FB45DRAFT_787574 [Roridomyces roridus]|uniref:Protein EFR3 n=1 Tax=Roridomyces roridus TaxID=1738132 RepID=A0AAD7FV66_9AGAR|nr:hypothetical protein FB45DRAFT_787574 [Roridomyces roridus]
MNFLFTPNHVQLLNACYPPTSALLTAGPDYSPNSQELSRLTYYASNHPSKLTKLGSELEKRVKAECRKAQSNLRTRASLLITLAIFRSLATECRRDIALISPSLVASIGAIVTAVPSDLEVVARAANVFTAWTTYTDGHLIGADRTMTQDYIAALTKFASLACSDAHDQEVRNRTRLVGFEALTGALNSEALYNDSGQFRAQVSVMMRPILLTVYQTQIDILETQSDGVKDAPISPYLAEFRTRPAIERRAASIHAHIDGDTGPSMSDVSSAALRALFSLLEHANSGQLGHIMRASLDTLEDPKKSGWTQIEHCCWLSGRAVEWSQYQYRYAIPTWLVERLAENQESATVTPMHTALVAMVKAVFDSSTPLVNLSTSDIVSNLTTLVIRRASINPDDSLLPPLVECIASLGRHVYYSDQIQDLAGEIVNRLVAVEVQGAFNRGDEHRSQAIRCLFAGLLGLIHAAHETEAAKTLAEAPKRNRSSSFKVSSPAAQIAANVELGTPASSRRTQVLTDIWQDTLSLLCDADYAVRADYASGLVFYLENEIPTLPGDVDENGVRRLRRMVESPFQHQIDVKVLMQSGDFGTKFLNAMHAYVYTLATSTSLGFGDNVTNGPTTSEPDSTTDASEVAAPSQGSGGRRSVSSQAPRARKASVVQRLLERAPSRVSGSASASLSDYAHILSILTTVHEQFPIRGLIVGIPMLLALDKAARSADVSEAGAVARAVAIKVVIAKVWLVIGKTWESSELVNLANKALASVPAGADLPSIPELEFGMHPASQSVPFPSDAPAKPWEGLSSETALLAISSAAAVHAATELDTQAILSRLSVQWTAESALKDSVEKPSTFEATIRGDGLSPLLKISPALMHIENASLASLTRSTRGVGVTDLREALEGRSSMSNPALVRPPSLSSTLDHTSSIGIESRLARPRSRTRSRRVPPSGSEEVRDVLTRLGIGKQNGSLLKASFPLPKPGGQRMEA